MYKFILGTISLLFLFSCSSEIYKSLPKKYATKERIEKTKNFANAFFEKCNKNDYSEIKGFDLDINFKNQLSSKNLEEGCKIINNKLGKIYVGSYNNAITLTHPRDYMDIMVFKAKSEKNDTVKFVIVGIYRDKDFIETIKLTDRSTPKIHYKIIK